MVQRAYLARLLARWITITVLLTAFLFIAAGTTQIATLRVYLAVFAAFLLSTMLAVSPELAEERTRPGQSEVRETDRMMSGFLYLATLCVAARDAGQIHFGPEVPAALGGTCLLLFVVAMALQLWAMANNSFFSPVIRLQRERKHRVISTGPYRIVRHPGYLAMLICAPASALALGSWLALIPALAFDVVVYRRVGSEDAFLRANLPGYEEYRNAVQDRLVPFDSRHKGVLKMLLLGLLSIALVASKRLPTLDLVAPVPRLLSPLPNAFCELPPSVATLETHGCWEQ
jgi:protein-S-isoprenylcysteine O-methyltransferase Ste14